ncbi:MAG: NACHT domain-containing protein [Synechococcaceae cyanobacterium SM2_3_2]|nr:NACHT domain-containing protein [Synechococcaceae cyanobacterium SM2_3_2]
MPRVSFGPTVRDRAECLLRHFLRTFHTQLHRDPQAADLNVYPAFWASQSERHNKLEVKTTLDALNQWVQQDPVSEKCRAIIRPGKLGRAEIQEALSRLQDIGILKRHPLTTRPITWHFTLILPRTPISEESIAYFHQSWPKGQPLGTIPPAVSKLLGRTADIDSLLTRYHQGDRLILLYGPSGQGKSSLARQVLTLVSPAHALEMVFSQDPTLSFPLQDWLSSHLMAFQLQPSTHWTLLLDQWRHLLNTQSISILVDGFDKALTPTGQIQDPHWLDWLKVLSHPRNLSLSLLTSQQVIEESTVTTKIYHLAGLTLTDWHTYFQQCGIHPPAHWEALHAQHQGNPKVMRQMANTLRQPDIHKRKK